MSPDATHAHPAALAHQFDSLQQQSEVTTLGMWVFLATEVLFFGGLFTTYLVYRHWYPDAFTAASRALLVWAGTTNTAPSGQRRRTATAPASTTPTNPAYDRSWIESPSQICSSISTSSATATSWSTRTRSNERTRADNRRNMRQN